MRRASSAHTTPHHTTTKPGAHSSEASAGAVGSSADSVWYNHPHAPLAIKAGVAAQAIESLAAGRRPQPLLPDEECVVDFVTELMRRHGVSDATYEASVACFGTPQTVELTALAGYFAMVCWIMNVARTPGPAGSATPGLTAFPA